MLPFEETRRHPELVFGLVGALGTDLDFVEKQLCDALDQVSYGCETIRLSRLMRGLSKPPWAELPERFSDEYLDLSMKAGNELRRQVQRGEALALLAVGAIQQVREDRCSDAQRPLPQFAYLLHSLKHPSEVEMLRRIYGPAFFLVAAYSPREQRLQSLARRIAESHHESQTTKHLPAAEQLMQRDEAEAGDLFGQNVRDTFPLADVIIDAGQRDSAGMSIRRFVELLFGNAFHTPTRDEQGMFHAQAAAYRSSSLARQVGAVLTREDGSLVALGTNDAPRAGGGLYWCDDEPDGRDFHSDRDTSDLMKENLLADILQRLQGGGWLSSERAQAPIVQLVQEALRSGSPPAMKGAQFTNTIDYVRAVHAEMAALGDAQRHGVPTKNCVLYTTTFPCHDCAKHLVTAGIKKVIYVEPYPKSLVHELYKDSIAVDSQADQTGRVHFLPFMGIAPRRYTELFALGKKRRKNPDGTVIRWRRTDAAPQLPEHMPSPVVRLVAEQEEFNRFMITMRQAGLAETTKEETDGATKGLAD